MTEITSENNLRLQVEEIVLDYTEQCQQHTHCIRNVLDDIIKKCPRQLREIVRCDYNNNVTHK